MSASGRLQSLRRHQHRRRHLDELFILVHGLQGTTQVFGDIIRVCVTDLEAVKALLTRNPVYEACGMPEIVSYLSKPGRFSCRNALNQGCLAVRSWH